MPTPHHRWAPPLPLTGLWRRYLADRSDVQARNTLALAYEPLVGRVAGAWVRHTNRHLRKDEARSFAWEGLLAALLRFDPSRGVKFDTFASRVMWGACGTGMRKADTMTRRFRSIAGRWQAVRQTVEAAGDRVTDHALSVRLGIPLSGVLAMAPVVLACGAPTMDVSRAHVAGRNGSPLAAVMHGEVLQTALRGLSRDQRLTILLYYCEGLTMKKIGLVLELSESRVSQIHAASLEHMRGRWTEEELCPSLR